MSQDIKPIFFGCAGTELSAAERDFFAGTNPFGFILFQRNCNAPEQVKALVQSLCACVGRDDVQIWIDQEGGRVARLKPPHWPALPALRRIGALFEQDAERGTEALALHATLTARRLYDLGINGNCSPVLDLYIEGASTAIGDRAISRDPLIVCQLAQIIVDCFLENGVMPVIKHLPGHGRVLVDPHEVLPVVDTSLEVLEVEDFVPFRMMSDAPAGMNCHVLFKALDDKRPVSLSPKIHSEIIRGHIGFDGLLLSDDLAMHALSGSRAELAQQALSAGADIALYCPGDLPEMQAIAAALPAMTKQAQARWQTAKTQIQQPNIDFDAGNAYNRLMDLLAESEAAA